MIRKDYIRRLQKIFLFWNLGKPVKVHCQLSLPQEVRALYVSVGWIVFSKSTSGRTTEGRSTFLHILQRRRQVEKVSAHFPCAIAQVERSPSPLGKEGNKCMSHGCELMQGRGKLWDFAACSEERGDWEETKKRSRLCSYMTPAELWSLFRAPAFRVGDPGRDKDACLRLLWHNRINPLGTCCHPLCCAAELLCTQ